MDQSSIDALAAAPVSGDGTTGGRVISLADRVRALQDAAREKAE